MTRKTAKRKGVVFDDPHLTKQDHGGGADINAIAQQYMSGRLPYPEHVPLQFADVSGINVAESRNLLAAVDSAFAELPSEVRRHFGDDSQRYIEFLHANPDAIAEQGLRNVLWEEIHPKVSDETDISAKDASDQDEPAPESTVDPT